jgi:hypothetical protein
MYLLVCLNVLLDLFMGCSSGGARIRDDGVPSGHESKMAHFRTLDWGMPALRRILVQLDYKLHPNGEIVASSITYVGFVGVLTGVRKDLSMSLNFRGIHNDMDKFVSNFQYYGHHLMVLMGLRPSISSVLRTWLLRPANGGSSVTAEAPKFQSYGDIVDVASCRTGSVTTSACYLCFSSGEETTVIEKDRVTAISSSSSSFIVVTNADSAVKADDSTKEKVSGSSEHNRQPVTPGSFTPDLQDIIEEADHRKQCARDNYDKLVSDRRSNQADHTLGSVNESEDSVSPSMDDMIEMVQKYPTTNECTHFAAILDPKAGKVAWSRYWVRPIGAKWIREHGGVD